MTGLFARLGCKLRDERGNRARPFLMHHCLAQLTQCNRCTPQSTGRCSHDRWRLEKPQLLEALEFTGSYDALWSNDANQVR